jgi:methylisocitrate lyase
LYLGTGKKSTGGDIPVFVDIDTGFGDVNNTIRAVRDCEQAGAAGLFIEDETFPKRCGHMAGKNVIPQVGIEP